jgi:hypothetical protein
MLQPDVVTFGWLEPFAVVGGFGLGLSATSPRRPVQHVAGYGLSYEDKSGVEASDSGGPVYDGGDGGPLYLNPPPMYQRVVETDSWSGDYAAGVVVCKQLE